jgi:hemolysin D
MVIQMTEAQSKAYASARKVIPLPRGARRDRHELAFLPAALEIVETPPSPIGRAIGVTIRR